MLARRTQCWYSGQNLAVCSKKCVLPSGVVYVYSRTAKTGFHHGMFVVALAEAECEIAIRKLTRL